MRGRYFSSALLKQLAPVRTPLGDGIRTAAAADGTQPTHDPLLEPRDEAVFLLTVAAEVEHALMVQYLYAAYSVRAPRGTTPTELDRIQDLLFQIAREEMGHLATVQNLLHLIGGPLNFNREHSPYASELYPFRFKLEPLTPGSLAKYVIAESPLERPPRLPAQDRQLLEQLEVDAQHSNDGRPVNHVGVIFARLQRLFRGGDGGLLDEDFRLDRHQLQAKSEDWGYTPGRPSEGEALIIESFPAADTAHLRSAAVTAVKEIGAQGEGFDLLAGPEEEESHFERFLDLYKRVKTLSDTGVQVTWPLTENANTTEAPRQPPNPAHMVDVVEEAYAARGRITHPRAKAWAQLFNLRYRLLLGHLSHFLRLSQELYVTEPGPHLGDRTARGLLLIWTFNEMRHLKRIAGKLVQLPRDEPPGDIHAGPPFELPYTLNLPDREEDRWRTHLDVSRASVRLVRERLQPGDPGDPTDQHDDFLKDLVASDEQVQVIMQSLAAGTGVPEGRLPTGFHKAVVILEEAVRGFEIRPGAFHDHFWADKTRDRFLATDRPPHPVEPFNPDQSPLIQRLESTVPRNRMPRFRPPVPAERIRFLRDWISAGAPDSVPAGKIGVHHERPPEQEPVPGQEPVAEAPPAPTTTPPTTTPPTTTPPVSFATDIRPLFRESPDREIMLKMGPFDLHRFEDVRDHADRILARLKLGDMPCDGSWPPDRVATFRKWIDDGKQP
jgi:rubrerythrin